MEKLCNMDRTEILKINIGGTVFICNLEIFKNFPESFLANLHKQEPNYKNREYYFDRNPYMFAYILDGFRKSSIHLPKDICGTTFKAELEYWEISKHHVASCCWETLYKSDEDMFTMQKLIDDYRENSRFLFMQTKHRSLRNQVWLFLDEPSSSKFASVWAVFISLLIVLSTLTEAIATTPLFTFNYTEPEKRILKHVGELLNWDDTTYRQKTAMKPHPYLTFLDIVCHIIITLEFIVSMLICPNKRAYLLNFYRICTIIGYLSFWIKIILQSEEVILSMQTKALVVMLTVLGYLTILKVARLFYVAKRIPAFGVIGLTLSSSKTELKILTVMLAILVSIFGFAIYYAENTNSKISNVFIGMYWALITVTTVGYGDYTPETLAGHVIAVACSCCGALILALPIGIISSSFYTFYNYSKFGKRHFDNCRIEN